MALEEARNKFKEYLNGDAVPSEALSLLHSLFPEDFEFYSMAFEIVNNLGVVTDRFILPVLPDSITINKRRLTNIRKTAQGVSVLKNNSFVPIPITIEGTFGRGFKLMVGSYEKPNINPLTGGMLPSVPFAATVKTGYGALKMLERMFDKVSRGSGGKTNTVIFYNLAFNQQYVIEFGSFRPSMSVSQNMIWRYSLDFTAVAPANTGIGQQAFKRMELMGYSAINTRISDTVTEATLDAFNEFVPPAT